MKIYVAGPMTGHKDWNFPAFFDAQEKLESLGHEVINPAHNDGETLEKALASAGTPERPNNTWGYYMRRDLPHVLDVDALCVLPGWRQSKGASLEVHVAEALGLPIYILKDGVLTPRVRIIGLSGYARSGKDTTADYLVEKYGYTKMSFAAPMKEALYKLNPDVRDISELVWTVQQVVDLSGWEGAKEITPDVRGLLQRFGTEVGREMFGENFWVDLAMSQIPDGSKIVVSDVRFPNEADAIKKLGGKVLRVERDGVEAVNAHISETALDGYDFDVRIPNNKDITALHFLIETLINGLERDV